VKKDLAFSIRLMTARVIILQLVKKVGRDIKSWSYVRVSYSNFRHVKSTILTRSAKPAHNTARLSFCSLGLIPLL
jgi:hypothetical protein